MQFFNGNLLFEHAHLGISFRDKMVSAVLSLCALTSRLLVSEVGFGVRVATRNYVVIITTPVSHVSVHLLVESVVQLSIGSDVTIEFLERRRRLQLQRLRSLAHESRQLCTRVREHGFVCSALFEQLQGDCTAHTERELLLAVTTHLASLGRHAADVRVAQRASLA